MKTKLQPKFKLCTKCKAHDWEDSHDCLPEWKITLVQRGEEAMGGDTFTVHATSARAALEAWATAYDDEGAEWRIVGQDASLAVWVEGGGRVDRSMPGGRHPKSEERLFKVSGAWAREYSLEEVA